MSSQIEALRGVRDVVERAAAAQAYIARGEALLTEARAIRDAAIKEAAGQLGVSSVARTLGLSRSFVKAVRSR